MSKFIALISPHLSLLYCPIPHIIIIIVCSSISTLGLFHSISIPTYITSIDRSIHSHFIYFQLTPTPFQSSAAATYSLSCSLLSYSPSHILIAHTHYITHSALISLLLQLHAITQLYLSPTQLFRHTTFTLPLNFSHL